MKSKTAAHLFLAIMALAAHARSSCSSGCKSCNYSRCLQCKTGYYLTWKTCYKCSTGCSACSSSTNCQTCQSGWVKSNSENRCERNSDGSFSLMSFFIIFFVSACSCVIIWVAFIIFLRRRRAMKRYAAVPQPRPPNQPGARNNPGPANEEQRLLPVVRNSPLINAGHRQMLINNNYNPAPVQPSQFIPDRVVVHNSGNRASNSSFPPLNRWQESSFLQFSQLRQPIQPPPPSYISSDQFLPHRSVFAPQYIHSSGIQHLQMSNAAVVPPPITVISMQPT